MGVGLFGAIVKREQPMGVGLFGAIVKRESNEFPCGELNKLELRCV